MSAPAGPGPRPLHAPARAEARRFFRDAGPGYDRTARWATLLQDGRWRRAALRRLPRGPADVLDLGCGTGLLTVAAAQRCSPGRVVGVDASPGMLAVARAKVEALGLANVELVEADAEAWDPPPGAFDAVLAGYLPKYVDPDRWLPRAAAALRPGGVLVAYDFTYPANPAARALWEAWWCVLQPALAAQPAWARVAAELPGMVRGGRWLQELREALPRHGFHVREVFGLSFGAAALVEAARGLGPPAAAPGTVHEARSTTPFRGQANLPPMPPYPPPDPRRASSREEPGSPGRWPRAGADPADAPERRSGLLPPSADPGELGEDVPRTGAIMECQYCGCQFERAAGLIEHEHAEHAATPTA